MNDRPFAHPDRNASRFARVVSGHGGLPKVLISSPVASGEMYLHGGQVMSWTPAGADPVLFVSEQARWADGRAVRGGIPVCFPWFGPHATIPDAPSHGFVRTKAWQLDAIGEHAGVVTVTMSTHSTSETRRWWPADFRLVLRAAFGSVLTLELAVTNTGASAFRFEEALHTYYRVGPIGDVRIRGLDGLDYLDTIDGHRQKTQTGDVVIGSEVDRIYLDTGASVDIIDAGLRRRLHLATEDSRTTVVWNPWIDKARSLADLADHEWERFVCVETCNVVPAPVELAPGQPHTMRVAIGLGHL